MPKRVTPTLYGLLFALVFCAGCSEFVPREPANTPDNGAPPIDLGPNLCQDTVCDDQNPCTVDSCDASSGECTTAPRPDGSTCDDGLFCTKNSLCEAGACAAGTPIDCPGAEFGCRVGQCDEETDQCVLTNALEDSPCDADSCVTDQACDAGVCAGGIPVSCPEPSDPCVFTECVAAEGGCIEKGVADQASCEGGDDDPCTVNEVCIAGSCEGEPKDCTSLDLGCNVGQCIDGICTSALAEDGAGCSDENPCTDGDVCDGGVCAGLAKDCAELDSQCTQGICNGLGECVEKLLQKTCDDGDGCTQVDVCQAGQCVGGDPKDCSVLNTACSIGVCQPDTGNCLTAPGSSGAVCNDQDPCTSDDVCNAGVCGGTGKDCGAAALPCQIGTCNPDNGACLSKPSALLDGTGCDDGDFCTTGDLCIEGECTGGPKDCSEFAEDCMASFCDALNETCATEPVPNGTACDDGKACTQLDECIGGFCSGTQPTDCSDLDGPCGAGFCSEVSGGSCEVDATPDGEACDDVDLCTSGDTCQGGVCSGTLLDCTSINTDCQVGACDPATGECTPDPVPAGALCDDGVECTVGDQCSGGACQPGTPVDCPCPGPARALQLSGGCVEIGGHPFLQDVTGFTLEFWLRSTSKEDAILFDQRITEALGESDWHISYAVDSEKAQLRFRYGNVSGFDSQIGMPSVELNDGAWHHIAVTRDDSVIRWWVDGSGTAGNNVSNSQALSNSKPLLIGCDKFQENAPWQGELDEIRVSNFARYTKSFSPAGRHLRDASTVALWHADDPPDIDALKDSANGHLGVITGAHTFVQDVAVPTCCGDGFLSPGEECDDAQITVGDGCDAVCIIEGPLPQHSLALDGNGDCVQVAGDDLLTTVGDLTFELWLKTTDVSVSVVDKRISNDGGETDWHLDLEANGKPIFFFGNELGGETGVVAKDSVSDGEWHHLVIMITSAGLLRFFQDGAPGAVHDIGSAKPLGNSADLWLGCAFDQSSFFAGQLDAVRATPKLIYTIPFEPPAALLPLNKTELLYSFDQPSLEGSVLDSSSGEHLAAVLGNPQLSGDVP